MKASSNTSYEYVKPALADLLARIKLDKTFDRAEGNYLYSGTDRILDLAGGYGSCLLGHNHPALVRSMTEALASQIPVHAQLSLREEAGLLASELDAAAFKTTGKHYITTLANSGAEAVEAAIKLARYIQHSKVEEHKHRWNVCRTNLRATEQNVDPAIYGACSVMEDAQQHNQQLWSGYQSKIISLDRAFHGKTSGALKLTHNPKFKEAFHFEQDQLFLKVDQPEKLEELLRENAFSLYSLEEHQQAIECKEEQFNQICAIIVEPVQGEGGIREIPEQTLRYFRTICDRHGILLIFDEIQCGLFRCGSFFTSTVPADIHLFGKQLGGGLVKNSAVLIEKSIYPEQFGLLQTSTFAEDELSARISRKALELLQASQDEILNSSRALMDQLRLVQEQFPQVLIDVRGKGLMIGIEFRDFDLSQNYSLQSLSRSGYFSYLLCSYLLNCHGVRMATTLSAPNVLRIEPSAFLNIDEIRRIGDALTQLCTILDLQDNYCLIRHILPESAQNHRTDPVDFRQGPINRCPSFPERRKVGFMTHFITSKTLKSADPSLADLNEEEVEELLNMVMPVAKPIFAGSQLIRSGSGSQVELYIIGCIFTSRMAKKALQDEQTEPLVHMIQTGLNMLEHELGVTHCGLGQYTSILTRNGKSLYSDGMYITTGNSYTTALGIQSLEQACSDQQVDLSLERVAVVGAAGNIGSVLAQCLSARASGIMLFGSHHLTSLPRLHEVAESIIIDAYERCRNGRAPRSPMEEKLFQTTSFKHIVDVDPTKLYALVSDELKDAFPIRISIDLNELRSCRLVVAAANASSPFIELKHLASNAIICDLAVPLNSTKSVLAEENGHTVVEGGLANLPGKETIEARGFPLPEGVVFGCLAETLLLGMEGLNVNYSMGPITANGVERIEMIGKKHGLSLKQFKTIKAL